MGQLKPEAHFAGVRLAGHAANSLMLSEPRHATNSQYQNILMPPYAAPQHDFRSFVPCVDTKHAACYKDGMVDRLDAEIEKARAHAEQSSAIAIQAQQNADAAKALAEQARVRLEALQLAASLRPPASPPSAGPEAPAPPYRGDTWTIYRGRVPGSISRTWREILSEMAVRYPDGASEEQIAEIARKKNLLNVRTKDVRDRMDSFKRHDYVADRSTGWVVTKTAFRRFNLESESYKRETAKKETAPDSHSGAVVQIESPSKGEVLQAEPFGEGATPFPAREPS